ncbi:MAG: hypothetical protein GY953_28290, partial [bacterium]|nr:hypothetical protein [bacterium]
MKPPQLYLHQELLLMALHDEKGTIDWKASQYAFAVGGALLAELFLAEVIRVAPGKKPLVEV